MGSALLRLSRSSFQSHDAVRADIRPPLARAVDPLHDNAIDARGRAETDVRALVAGRQIAAVGVHAAPQRRLTGPLDADARAEAKAIARRILQRRRSIQ